MKKQSENTISLNSNVNMEIQVTEVKETPVVKFNTLSPADLWNIQRRSRTMFQRRNCA